MTLENKEKIDILLKEYDTLRQEILHRMNNRFLMLGITGSFLAFILLTDTSIINFSIFGFPARVVIFVFGLLALIFIWVWFGYLVGNIARQVSVLECRINEISGEDLLEWETRYGWGRWGKYLGAKKVE